MTTLLLVGWLSLPLAPLNPVQQDTLSSLALHVTGGLNIDNGVVGSGPDISAKMEMLAHHPLVIRGALDYRYGQVTSRMIPDGSMHVFLISVEALYYKGTDRLTGYVGFGLLYSMGSYNIASSVLDSLRLDGNVFDSGLKNTLGYRITLGLRLQKSLSFELGITEIKPKFVLFRQLNGGLVEEDAEQFRNGSFRVSVGYVLPLLQ